MVSLSIGKKPQVAPYSGAMLAMVARSARPRLSRPGTIKFDEFIHDAAFAQHLRYGQHQIGGGRALGKPARHFETDHFRDQHRYRLAQHRGFRLDPADAPAQHGKAVHHGRVAVGADQRIGIGDLRAGLIFFYPDRLRQIFQVHLMADAGAGRDNTEIVKRILPPAQEFITLQIAFERLAAHIIIESLWACRIHPPSPNDRSQGLRRLMD